MSFKGVNFTNQRLLAADLGRLLQLLCQDGIVYGCDLSYSGYNLSMSPGMIVVGGRLLRLDTTQTWTISGATSGYARVVLTIDLSRTSTAYTFDQVQTRVDYSSYGSFAGLTKGDINGVATLYEVELAQVYLNYYGISSITAQLPPGKSEVDIPTAKDFENDFAPKYTSGTGGMTPNSSYLATGTLYVQYE